MEPQQSQEQPRTVPCAGYCPCDTYFNAAEGERCMADVAAQQMRAAAAEGRTRPLL